MKWWKKLKMLWACPRVEVLSLRPGDTLVVICKDVKGFGATMIRQRLLNVFPENNVIMFDREVRFAVIGKGK